MWRMGIKARWVRAVSMWWSRLPRPVRLVVVCTTSLALGIAGVAMLVLPGPGVLVLAAALGVLASEFTWARSLLRKVKAKLRREGQD